jgi:hypothetical protein
MKTPEYKMVNVPLDLPAVESTLKELAAEGWDLVQAIPTTPEALATGTARVGLILILRR